MLGVGVHACHWKPLERGDCRSDFLGSMAADLSSEGLPERPQVKRRENVALSDGNDILFTFVESESHGAQISSISSTFSYTHKRSVLGQVPCSWLLFSPSEIMVMDKAGCSKFREESQQ